jgi:hypothetical protein
MNKWFAVIGHGKQARPMTNNSSTQESASLMRMSMRNPRVWGSALLAGFFLIYGGGEILLGLMDQTFGVLFELLEEWIERFYRKTFTLSHHQAQMATAYTYFVLGIAAACIFMRLFLRWADHVYHYAAVGLHMVRNQLRARFLDRSLLLKVWWESLDWLNKSAVVIASIVLIIPVMAVVSYGLGVVLAEIL